MPTDRNDWLLRLDQPRPLWLDGPTGTQLEAAGFVSHPLLWTARASLDDPACLAKVHRRYREAGAQCLTANTFRTTAFAAKQAGVDPALLRRCAQQAVHIARQVCSEGAEPGWVLGSMAPLSDCYLPMDAPSDEVLAREHARNADWLLEAGCDGLLIETQGSAREALQALRAARRCFSGPILVSFLLGDRGDTLLAGDDLSVTAQACLDSGASALLLNCSHTDVLLRGLPILAALQRNTGSGSRPIGAYPNADRRYCEGGT